MRIWQDLSKQRKETVLMLCVGVPVVIVFTHYFGWLVGGLR